MGVHPAGDSFAPVEWLVAFLHQRNIGLYTGQIIITGSLNGLWRLPVNQPVTIEYAELATVEIEFTSALNAA
jgi:2-keto-4-pentenoate hydratase